MENLEICTRSWLLVEERKSLKLSKGEKAGGKPSTKEMNFLAAFRIARWNSNAVVKVGGKTVAIAEM